MFVGNRCFGIFLALSLCSGWVTAAGLCQNYSGLPGNWGKDAHAGMVFIASGEFEFGSRSGYPEERDVSHVSVSGFWMDQTEVTVAQFADFVAKTGYVSQAEQQGGGVVFVLPSQEALQTRAYPWWQFQQGAHWRQPQADQKSPAKNLPVSQVTLVDALAYAHWLGRDLPTETEWEYAAKAGLSSLNLEKEPRDSKGKPQANFWQGGFPDQNNAEDGYAYLAPVGCYPANAFNLYDMLGNVWEQTQSPYTASHNTSAVPTTSTPQIAEQAMVIKGGSHLCSKNFCVRYRPSGRESHEANLPISHIGFRTVRRDNP